MANTEGMNDEDLSHLLSLRPTTVATNPLASLAVRPDTSLSKKLTEHDEVMKIRRSLKQSKLLQQDVDETADGGVVPRDTTRIPQGLMERKLLMNDFQRGGRGDSRPSARVIRSSRNSCPVIKRSKEQNLKENGDSSCGVDFQNNVLDQLLPMNATTSAEATPSNLKSSHPVLLADSIIERQLLVSNGKFADCRNKNIETKKRKSRFKIKSSEAFDSRDMIREKSSIEEGMPSFDIPIGTLTRKGRENQMNCNKSKHKSMATPSSKETPKKNTSFLIKKQTYSGAEAESILVNMSRSEIREGLVEIENSLSAETVTFLRNRRRRYQETDLVKKQPAHVIVDDIKETRSELKASEIIASIRTEDELEEVFSEMMGIQYPRHVEMEQAVTHRTDLESSSILLRSTAVQQRNFGAKRTYEILEERLKLLVSKEGAEYRREDVKFCPPLLPVALRCLLDLPSPHKHRLLHTYILRAIHALVLLFCHPDHRVCLQPLSRGDFVDPISIFQLNFLHDAIPVPPVDDCYSSTTQKQSLNEEGCYSTDSSAQSALIDSKAFYADPMWTLLSRMKFLPCICDILLSAHKLKEKSNERRGGLSPECITAICGILAILSLRSQGAACAISQHKHILPCLISFSLDDADLNGNIKLDCIVGGKRDESKKDEGIQGFFVNTKFALPVVILLCTLCRQSRCAACTKGVISAIQYLKFILAISAESDEEWILQRWCIVLWRTLLRYGIAISELTTLLPLSVAHLTTQQVTKYSLTAEYLSSYSLLCDCAKIQTQIGSQASDDQVTQYDKEKETLSMAGIWLSSHSKKAADFLIQMKKFRGIEIDVAEIKIASARLRMLSSYVSATNASFFSKNNPKLVPVIGILTCLNVVETLVHNGVVYQALQLTLKYAYASDCEVGNPMLPNCSSYIMEGTACGFVDAFFSMMDKLLGDNKEGMDADYETKIASVSKHIFALIINILHKSSYLSRSQTSHRTIRKCSSARIGWLNRAHLSVCKYLTLIASLLVETDPIHSYLPSIQSFAFYLIGRLKRGDEAMLAILLSQDILFINIQDGVISHSLTVVPGMMMRELCRTQHSQAQLDHSIKLLRGYGITTPDKGLFTIESLRSDGDYIEQPHSSDSDVVYAPLLPLNSFWLWHALSSTVQYVYHLVKEDVIQDSTIVVVATLRLLLTLEESNAVYVRNVSPGTKMYFLMNACLYPEEIISNNEFGTLFNDLYQVYYNSIEENRSKASQSFLQACSEHSACKKNHDNDFGRDEKLSDDLLIGNPTEGEYELKSKELRIVYDFIGDLCAAFTDHGAQYDHFIHCIRFFFRPEFPISIRMDVMKKLDDSYFRLLTTQTELDDMSSPLFLRSLKDSLSGGLPGVDGSKRDAGEFLDIVSSIIKRRNFTERNHPGVTFGGFFYLFAVGHIARNLASISHKCISEIEAMRLRMKGMKANVLYDIVFCASLLVQRQNCTAHDLSIVLLDGCVKRTSLSCPIDDWEELVNDEVAFRQKLSSMQLFH